ncbi:MAG: hypothetical protein ABJN62_16260 [Halioglobus sp.]
MSRLIILLMLINSAAVYGADSPTLFSSDELFKAVLTAPILQAYGQKKQEDRLYLGGHWSQKKGEETERVSVKIRTRGNFRRRNCVLPPLMLNFKKKELEGTSLAGQNKLKLVSPCKRGDKYQQLIYLEYHVYQLFALYSDYHFRTRLVEVAYVDTGGKDKRWQSTNFLIEDDKDMAARYQLDSKKVPHTMRVDMDMQQTALVEAFQYMIGNVDYSTLQSPEGADCCHNIKLLAPEGVDKSFLPVAYDFDSSGIINAPYAALPTNVPIRRITTRYFNGWCKEERRFRDAIDLIKSKKEAAIAIFEESTLLSNAYRKRAASYLKKSYDKISDEKTLKREVLEQCRGEVIKG